MKLTDWLVKNLTSTIYGRTVDCAEGSFENRKVTRLQDGTYLLRFDDVQRIKPSRYIKIVLTNEGDYES